MCEMASQITRLTIVYLTVYSDTAQRKNQPPPHWPLCGNSPVTGQFPAQVASNAENISIWLRHHVDKRWFYCGFFETIFCRKGVIKQIVRMTSYLNIFDLQSGGCFHILLFLQMTLDIFGSFKVTKCDKSRLHLTADLEAKLKDGCLS